MTAFDPSEAAGAYAELQITDLVAIAYLDEGYLPEAKGLAVRELEKRGVAQKKDELIVQARADLEERRRWVEDARYAASANHDRIRQKISVFALIAILWIFALLTPAFIADKRGSMDSVLILLGLGWAISVLVAIKRARDGNRRLIYQVLVVPVVLAIVGAAIRFT